MVTNLYLVVYTPWILSGKVATYRVILVTYKLAEKIPGVTKGNKYA